MPCTFQWGSPSIFPYGCAIPINSWLLIFSTWLCHFQLLLFSQRLKMTNESSPKKNVVGKTLLCRDVRILQTNLQFYTILLILLICRIVFFEHPSAWLTYCILVETFAPQTIDGCNYLFLTMHSRAWIVSAAQNVLLCKRFERLKRSGICFFCYPQCATKRIGVILIVLQNCLVQKVWVTTFLQNRLFKIIVIFTFQDSSSTQQILAELFVFCLLQGTVISEFHSCRIIAGNCKEDIAVHLY